MKPQHLDHPKGEPCAICDAERSAARCSNAEIQELYSKLDSINHKPPYTTLIREINKDLRREGKPTINFLSELSSAQVRNLIEACRPHEKRPS